MTKRSWALCSFDMNVPRLCGSTLWPSLQKEAVLLSTCATGMLHTWLGTWVLVDSSFLPEPPSQWVVCFYLADLLLPFLIWLQSSPIAAALPVLFLVLISGEALQKEEICSFSNGNR